MKYNFKYSYGRPEPLAVKLDLELQVGAIFQARVYRADGSLKTESAKFNNLVLDRGLAHLTSQNANTLDCLFVGTGNSEPIATQVRLDNAIAQQNGAQSRTGGIQVATAPYYVYGRHVYRFPQGAAKGNITEMGIGQSVVPVTDNLLFNRVLVRDSHGEPTSITVLSDEFLEVTVEFRMYYPSEISGSFQLKDKLGKVLSTHNYTGRPCLTGSPQGYNLGRVVFDYNANNTSVGSDKLPAGVTTKPTAWASCSSKTSYPRAGVARATMPFGLDSGNGRDHKSFFIPIVNIFNDVFQNGYMWELDVPIRKTNTQLLNYYAEISFVAYTGG